MKRRAFIAFLGGATAWPLAARAQGPALPVVGFLSNRTAAESENVVAAFRQGLGDSGYAEGHNVTIDYRLAEDQLDRLPGLAADLVRRPVSVIAATGGIAAAQAAKAATKTIPIVFANGTDPIKFGLVDNLERPGQNITGVSLFAAAPGSKRLELLRELVPGNAPFAVLADPSNADAATKASDLQAAADALGQPIEIVPVRSVQEFDAAFAGLVRRGVRALLVSNEVLFTSHRDQVTALAAHHAIPAIYAYQELAAAGGLMSYGPSRSDGYRQCGIYVARILKGEKPGDLPVRQPGKFELVINRKAAKAMGIEIPPALLGRADDVIE
ncbi:MAG TPA: ABC transporter substrate-binding protein [Xanthobacteraceae bacterium]|jgi:putative ABC transport system substrate-binding protein